VFRNRAASSPGSAASSLVVTCRGIAGSPPAPWPTHRRSRRSSCALRPCAETSGNIAFFSPPVVPLPESVPIANVPIQGVIPFTEALTSILDRLSPISGFWLLRALLQKALSQGFSSWNSLATSPRVWSLYHVLRRGSALPRLRSTSPSWGVSGVPAVLKLRP
jgi:hypothetical protein